MIGRALALAAASLGVAVACTRTPRDDGSGTTGGSTTVASTKGGATTVASGASAIDSPAIGASPLPPAPSRRSPAGVTDDTLHGVVLIVGAVPETMVALRTADGTITLGGPAVSALRSVVGAEVLVEGRRGSDPLRAWLADRFIVRAVDGRAARDGILEADGDALLLRLIDGSRSPIVDPPAALRTHVGARVWIAGAAGASPDAWGVIGTP